MAADFRSTQGQPSDRVCVRAWCFSNPKPRVPRSTLFTRAGSRDVARTKSLLSSLSLNSNSLTLSLKECILFLSRAHEHAPCSSSTGCGASFPPLEAPAAVRSHRQKDSTTRFTSARASCAMSRRSRQTATRLHPGGGIAQGGATVREADIQMKPWSRRGLVLLQERV